MSGDLFSFVMLSGSETSLDVLQRRCETYDQRFFASLRMTGTLSSPSAATENATENSTNDLTTELAAGGAHRALGH